MHGATALQLRLAHAHAHATTIDTSSSFLSLNTSYIQSLGFFSGFKLATFFWQKTSRVEAPKSAPIDIMAHPSPQPELKPSFCFSTVQLRDFLRISRSSIDDSITQNLNALLTPASSGFDPSSTSFRTPRPSNSRRIPQTSCQNFKNQVLFPSWQMRSDVLNYCASVATSPDPDDPESVLRQVESEKDRERIVDERLDPYSSRFYPTETRTERLAELVRQERGVENIVRARSWGLVGERCGEDYRRWDEALNDWRKGREGKE
ncbi:related to caffeine-induced death protein 2 Cid2 [Rhynchosporium secalis]|uniref:Related to caffeine-induced death protein 2 Cid2 n=1 Tax=Rhynchosporium secalis TaxID=38038 RepID=A0A1E1MG48_RHYSE|nr:related to caffeine-induced death protein 2 Cid2 [Rhynchosporium secalis]